MKRLLGLALGVVTAIGGFVDIGELVTTSVTGARFGTSLTWTIVLGTLAIMLYSEMSGRVAAVAKRPVFHVVRERLGARLGLANLTAATLLSVLTLSAEIGGMGLVLELVTGINYIIWIPLVGLAVWLTVWRVPFSLMENGLGVLGLALVVFAVALFVAPTDWGALWHGATHPNVPAQEGHARYFFYAISMFGACVMPYEVIFFSSGGREEEWTVEKLPDMRLNVLVGFPLGGLITIALMWAAAAALQPRQVEVNHLGPVLLPVAEALGPAGTAIALVGFAAAVFAAASECALSIGYGVSQYFGWEWGKQRAPRDAPRFHLVCLASIIAATAFVMTTIDPVLLTIIAVVLGVAAIPLTYFPILVVANDRAYVGERVNKGWLNAVAVLFLLLMVVVSVVTVPLLLFTKAGQ
jgi:Mn2+/Fe2+ NRAMP family transporter